MLILIIGAGAAGIMAAIQSKKNYPSAEVLLVDQTFAIGRKILVSGAGRCNLTNRHLGENPTAHFHGDTTFINEIFKQFGYEQIINFFHELGIQTVEEQKNRTGKIFPKNDQAKSVVTLLEDEIIRLGIRLELNTTVIAIKPTNKNFLNVVLQGSTNSATTVAADKVIIAAGGKTYPALGSNGYGFDLAQKLGHQIITPVPAALPLECKSQLCHLLQGVKVLANVQAFIDDNCVATNTEDVIFTKYGISGSAIFNISREISIAINRNHLSNCHLILNLIPEVNASFLPWSADGIWSKRPSILVNHSLYGILNTKIADAICVLSGIKPQTIVSELNPIQKKSLIENLTKHHIMITGTRGWNEAEFTAGGVNTGEINAKTMASKIIPNLYFAGEVIDVDGDVGGYNLSWAWSSGYVAGKNLL